MKLTFELEIDTDDTSGVDPLDLPDLAAEAIKSRLAGDLALTPATRLKVRGIEITPHFDIDPGEDWATRQ